MKVSLKFAARRMVLGLLFGVASCPAWGQTTAVFQNGLNGYNGTVDRVISDLGTGTGDERDLSTVASQFLDGYQADGTDANTLPDSRDDQLLIRFDNIIGNGPGQIPSGATILDAKLTFVTSLAGNAQTNGPFGVAGLVDPFDQNTSYFTNYSSDTNWGSRGPWWQDGSATRPVGGFGFQLQGGTDSASVAPLVQNWANGMPNHGMVVQAGLSDFQAINSEGVPTDSAANTADGWSIQTTGYPIADGRPKLEVTYTTEPIAVRTFQRGDTNGYASDTMAWVRSGPNVLTFDTGEETHDGLGLQEAFLDGANITLPDGTTNSPDDLALLKFGDVFGSGANQVATDVPVAKAWVVLTTGDDVNATTGNSTAHSSGPWAAHAVLRDWDTTTLHSDLGETAGLQVADGDISSALDVQTGMIRGAEVWFDVTSYLEGVRTGAEDYGIAIMAAGTADGWAIHFNGSDEAESRPRLVV